MWPDLIQKSKDGGLDIIETYVFWNSHEPLRAQVLFFIFFGLNIVLILLYFILIIVWINIIYVENDKISPGFYLLLIFRNFTLINFFLNDNSQECFLNNCFF